MSINFCSDGLLSSISCSSTCFEGYEVRNLVKIKGRESTKGFIADHYVKPPVRIILKFVCSIDVRRILIKTFVGAQRSCNFDLWTTTDRVGKIKVCSTTDLSNVDFVAFHRYGEEAFPSEWNLRKDRLGVPFDKPVKLKNVEGLELVIKKTCNSSVPCLGFLEVWGVPSKLVSSKSVLAVNKRWASFFEPLGKPLKSLEPEKTSPEPLSRLQVESFSKDFVPEEFIDPITCEIMLCPMVLPSGKIVDQTTLAKFYQAEEKFGRGKSDPFTGLAFSEIRKPVLDSVLKAKIDKFLVSNSDLDFIKKMPRVIGKKPNCSIPGLSVHAKLDGAQPSSSAQSSLNLPYTCGIQKKSKRTLDELISDSLNGLPSYLEAKVLKTSRHECGFCCKVSMLFKLPCSHLICRFCLLKNTKAMSLNCAECQKPYDRSEPVRYHNI